MKILVTGTTGHLGEALVSTLRARSHEIVGLDVKPGPYTNHVGSIANRAVVHANIYGATKLAAEDLCELFHRRERIPCVILKTSRFFPEIDDDADVRRRFDDVNVKANEFLNRRVDIQDVVDAHELALHRAGTLGFGHYIISATTPFQPEDLAELNRDAPAVLRRRVPEYVDEYARRGWSMFPAIDRVYSNERARRELGWQPRYDFARVVASLRANEEFLSPLARAIGKKGYHDQVFADGPFPVAG
jgi:UDP-glucose 4-epimerase